MTRSRRKSRPAPPPRARRPGRERWIAVAVGSAVLVGAVLWIRRTSSPPARPPIAPTASEIVLLDSLRAADARHDWPSGLLWAERLAITRPLDHGVLLARGKAWANYAIEPRAGRRLARPALRTSLERTACLVRAIGLVDSSSRAASSLDRWLESGTTLAEDYLMLGLPGEALLAYETIQDRSPDKEWPAMRAYWIRTLLYDPVNPDTSEYHERRMRLQGH